MAKLEDLDRGIVVEGILPNQSVTIKSVEWFGGAGVEVVYTTAEGSLATELLYRADEGRLRILQAGAAWSFGGDGALLRLVSEAHRIRLAYLFDPFVAVHTSQIRPLPHQIQAVYGCMLPRQPLRFLLADDPGAGKTIMAGLFIKELLIRGGLERCLVVAPGGLVDNWAAELLERFNLRVPILSNEMLNTGNPFQEYPFMIAKMHHLAWRDDLLDLLQRAPAYDLAIVDEAHKMSAHYEGDEVKRTLLYRMGKLLSEKARHFLLMTATPHSGYHEDFQLFLQLVDPDRFEGKYRGEPESLDTSDIMRRTIKENLVTMDGEKLFPPRKAETVKYRLSPEEFDLYNKVTAYVKTEMNRAERVLDPSKRNVVGFALTTLQRRLASSPEAIYQSLYNRRSRLEARVQEIRRAQEPAERRHAYDFGLADLGLGTAGQLDGIFEDPDAMGSEEEEALGDKALDAASAAQTIEELEKEIRTLAALEQQGKKVLALRVDTKWDQLSQLLQTPEMKDEDGTPRKVIVFTEHRATLNYLHRSVAMMLGDREAVLVIHGGMDRGSRKTVQEAFWYAPKARVLVGTDAAGEGINLHCANIVVNYDLPWNPNRLEQRFGRVHRIGQERTCYMWNMVAVDTREGQVFETLMEKIRREYAALEGRVFDVLGKAFEARPLRDLYLKAILSDETQLVPRLVDKELEQITTEVRRLLKEQATALPGLSEAEVEELQREMQRAEARKLQPHFISALFREAFVRLGGRISEREPGRYEVAHVPFDVRKESPGVGVKPAILESYTRITFEKEKAEGKEWKHPAAFVAPGHPLLDAVIDLTVQRWGDVLREGAILVDPNDDGREPRVLVYMEHAVQDARLLPSGKRAIASMEFRFLEHGVGQDWREAGYAPYLDYQPLPEAVPDPSDEARMRQRLDLSWLGDRWQEGALTFAKTRLVPDHLQRVRRERQTRVEKIKRLVDERLSAEMMHWSRKVLEYQAKVRKDDKFRLALQTAQERYDDLRKRRERRLRELDEELQVSPVPPRIVGGALVLPQGLVSQLVAGKKDRKEKAPEHAEDTKTSELVAMRAVLAIERGLGNDPVDVSDRRGLGYDIESWTKEARLRLIEVKARNPGAREVSFPVSEVRAGLNKPEEFILALVRVDRGEPGGIRYVRRPWKMELDFAVTKVDFAFDELWARGEEPS